MDFEGDNSLGMKASALLLECVHTLFEMRPYPFLGRYISFYREIYTSLRKHIYFLGNTHIPFQKKVYMIQIKHQDTVKNLNLCA
jgi:hypothetical protein